MNPYILIIIILVIVIVWLVGVLGRMHEADKGDKKEINLSRIMSLFENNKELSNAEIRKALGVSSRTAVRYMDELERSGQVEQVGQTGESVTYRLK